MTSPTPPKPTPRSTFFLRGLIAVGMVERALEYPFQVVLSFALVVGAYLLVHRWLLVAARKRLEAAARRSYPRFPAPMALTVTRVATFASIVFLADRHWPLAFALIAGASSITLAEILILRVLLRQSRAHTVSV